MVASDRARWTPAVDRWHDPPADRRDDELPGEGWDEDRAGDRRDDERADDRWDDEPAGRWRGEPGGRWDDEPGGRWDDDDPDEDDDDEADGGPGGRWPGAGPGPYWGRHRSDGRITASVEQIWLPPTASRAPVPQISGGRPYIHHGHAEQGHTGHDHTGHRHSYTGHGYSHTGYADHGHPDEAGYEIGADRQPLTGPIAIVGRPVIGDELRLPTAWCQLGHCVSRHTDPEALGEADIRARAVAAGWRIDAFGSLACPDCLQRLPFWSTRQLRPSAARPARPWR